MFARGYGSRRVFFVQCRLMEQKGERCRSWVWEYRGIRLFSIIACATSWCSMASWTDVDGARLQDFEMETLHGNLHLVRASRHALILTCEAHQDSISICGIVSTMDPARETALSASLIGSPKASSTEMASIAVRPTPPAQ